MGGINKDSEHMHEYELSEDVIIIEFFTKYVQRVIVKWQNYQCTLGIKHATFPMPTAT